jgi:pantetheine-phosphate adenylyltransferase
MTIAIYPGAFDPVHNGHIDIAARAARIFDQLIVAIYCRPIKNVLFTADERMEMVRRSIAHLANVHVTQYDQLTVDFVERQKAQVIVRGLRMAYDFDREYQMALTNKALAPGLETICLFTNLTCSFLSSSIVKEIATSGGDVSGMVPAHVKRALDDKVSRRLCQP